MRAVGEGDWSALSPAERSELAPVLQVYQYIVHDYAGPFSSEAVVEGALRGMVEALGDPHSSYFTPSESASFTDTLSGTYVGVGVVIQAAEDGTGALVVEVLPGGPAEAAGVEAGDVILAVDGVPLSGVPIDVVASLLKGQAGTRVTLTLHRGSGDAAAPTQVVVTRGPVELPSVTARVLAPGVGYMRIDQFNANTGEQFRNSLAHLRAEAGARGLVALVLDLRANPGGYVDDAVSVAGALVPEGPVVRIVDAGGAEVDYPASPEPPLPARIAVLVDGLTASAAEIVAGALQDSGALLVGQRTYGKGSVQSLIPLRDGGMLKLTAAHYYTPKGRAIDHVGLAPDVPLGPAPQPTDGLAPWGEGQAAFAVRGDSGPSVRALQDRLALLGYPVDDGAGFFGPGTLAALVRFEADRGLARDYGTSAAVRQALDEAVGDYLARVTQGDAGLAVAFTYLVTGRLPEGAAAGAGGGASP